MKARYATFFSYIGTHFRASEKLWFKEGGRSHEDPESVQGLIEIALLKLKPVNYPSFILSSRTDGGVHALKSCAHFDLEKYGTGVYEPDAITYQLNKFFYKTNSSIFIKKCLRVSDDFHARYSAISRTYLYRLATLKKNVVLPENSNIGSLIPIEEWRRSHFVKFHNFDIEKFKEGAKYFVGLHDFRTFKKTDKLLDYRHSRRCIYSFEVKPGRSLVTTYTSNKYELFDHWDIEITAKAFVHNQIRRMIGTLLSVAIGKLEPKDIKVMLQIPSKHSWHSFIQNSPPDGLYLCDVEYNPEDLIYDLSKDRDKQEIEESVSDDE